MQAVNYAGTVSTGFWRRFLPVWGAGALGALTLVLQPVPTQVLDQMAGVPRQVVSLLLLVNPLVLVTLLAAVGAASAHRVGLGSTLAGTRSAPAERAWGTAVAAGLVLAGVMLVVDWAWAPIIGPAWQEVLRKSYQENSLTQLALGVGYGGVTEEVMMRWGVMSVVAWALAKAFGHLKAGTGVPAWVFAASALVSAIAFAAGHIPALLQLVEPSPALLARTLVLNALAGLVYALFFWRCGLETAMAAHASTHFGFAAFRTIFG